MITKGDIVVGALRKAGIASASSLIKPSAAMLDDYLEDLDSFMAYLDGVQGVRIGYQFSDPEYGANTSDDSGLPDWAKLPVIMNLAVFILTDRNKPIKDSILSQAGEMLTALKLRTISPGYLIRRSDMPRGAGFKNYWWNRYYNEKMQKPSLETSDGVPLIFGELDG